MTTEGGGGSSGAVYVPGDVVYGDDPFKEDEAARPWLVISNLAGKPFHGEQYVVLTLTTRSWMDGLIEAPTARWIRGGTPEQSRIVPWSVQSLDHDDIRRWQGRVDEDLVLEATEALIALLSKEDDT